MAVINYVKFVRGTTAAFNNLAEKNSDTLYFISDSDEARGSLYLGSKLISKDISHLSELEDVAFDSVLKDRQILIYDEQNSKWINKAIIDAIGLMTGATAEAQGAAGLVPAPGIGQDGLFLRGDGVWATPVSDESNVDIKPDEKTISFSSDGITIALKDFGIKYYKYIPETNGVAAHYEAQVVNASNPWKEGLKAKVTIDENGQFVLGWFEEDPTVKEQINTLTSKVEEVNTQVQENVIQITNIKTSVTNLADLLNGKADASSVYTKAEVDAKILEADHLTRKTFNTLDEAKAFVESIVNPEVYIYMVASGTSETNKYVEYLYVEGVLEQVGSWETDLSDYATKEEVNTLSTSLGNISTRVENLEEFMNSEYFTNFSIRLDSVETDLNTIKECVIWKELS